MEKYYELKVDYSSLENIDFYTNVSMSDYSCIGVLDGEFNEEEIDSHLGEMSYCGGNLPEKYMNTLEGELEGKSQTYYFDSKEKAEKFNSYLKSKSAEIRKSILLEKNQMDWNSQWRENFKPIKLDNYDFTVYPEWTKNFDETSPYIKIYPGQGFGTGTHETTRMCLEALDDINMNSFEEILDFGCGSGILGNAVQKLQPQVFCSYYDIDLAALENCKQNLKINELGKYEVVEPKDKLSLLTGKYDLVFANILEHVLIAECNFLRSLETQYLILSGILETQKNNIMDLYQSHGFKPLKVLQRGDWVCLVLIS